MVSIDPNSIQLITDEEPYEMPPMVGEAGGIFIDPASIVLEEPELTFGRIGGRLKEETKRAVRSTLTTLTDPNIQKALGYLPGMPRYSENVEAYKGLTKQAQAESLKPDPKFQVSSGWIEDLVGIFPQIGSVIVGSALAGPAGGAAAMWAQIAGGTYEEQIKQGVDPNRARTAGMINASLQAPLETIGIIRGMKGVKNLVARQRALQGLIDLGISAGLEWTTEFFQSIPEAATAIWGEGVDKTKTEMWAEFLSQAPEMFKQGAYEGLLAAGANLILFGAGGAVGRGLTANRRLEEVVESEEFDAEAQEMEGRLRAQVPAPPGPGTTIDPATITNIQPPVEAVPELERRRRFAEERPSVVEHPPREYLRPEEIAVPERYPPAPPAPERPAPPTELEAPVLAEYPELYGREPTKVMRELRQRMGYGDLDTKIRDYAVLSPEQQVARAEELSTEVHRVFGKSFPQIKEYYEAMLSAAKEVKLPNEVAERLEFEFRPIISLESIDARLGARSLRDHKLRGEKLREFAALTQTSVNGDSIIALSLRIRDPQAVKRSTWHELYHVGARQLLPDDVYARQMEHFKGNEEDAADAFSDYIENRTTEQPSWIRAQWDKVIEFLERIGNWLKGKGFDRPEDVFGKLARGKYKPLERVRVRRPTEVAAEVHEPREYGYMQKVGYPRSYKGETLEEYEARIKTPAPEIGAEVEGAIYQGETETDIFQQIARHEWIDSETGLPFTTDTPDVPSIKAEIDRLRADELQFSTFDKSREPVDVTIDIEEGRFGKVRKELKRGRESFLDPNTDSPLDKSGAAFLNTRKYADYVAEMPDIGEMRPSEIFRYDPNTGKLMATIVTKGGKVKPALRESGFYASQRFVDAFAGLDPETGKYVLKEGVKDVSKTAEQTMDPTRFIQTIDQGFFGGPTQQYVLWPTRMTTLAKMAYSDDHKIKLAKITDLYGLTRGKDRKAVGDVIEFIAEKDAWADNTNDILQIPEVKSLLQKYSPQRKVDMVNAAKDLRKQFTQILRQMNMARRKRKQPEIPFLKKYRPHIMEQNLKSKLLGIRMTPESVTQKPEMPDFIQPNKPFNPREMARTGGLEDYAKERDIVTLMTDYIETAAKDIFDTNIVHNNKVYAATLRSIGLENAADGLERLTTEVYAGTTPRLTRAIRTVVPEAPLRMAYGLRRNLTRAVFPLNWTWNTFIQTSSAGITLARYGVPPNIAGLQYLLSPTVRQAVKRNAYSSIIKSRWGGRAAYQDVQGSILKNKRLQSSKLDTAEEYANFLTSAMEDALTGHAIVAAYYHGRKLGLKGRALWEYASEGGAKTQSMYNFQDTPGFLRNKEVGVAMPFQTFAFEVYNTVREMNLPVIRRLTGKAGVYETMSAGSKEGKALMRKRLGMIARWAAAIILTNAVVERALGRKPWVLSSFLPFIGYLMPSGWGGKYGRGPEMTPQQYVREFKEGITNVLEYGSWKRLRKWALRYHMLGGIQINRMWDGIEAVAQGGEVRNVRDREMFTVDPDEWWKAILKGPYTTTAGKEYIEKLEGKKSKKKKKQAKRQYIK